MSYENLVNIKIEILQLLLKAIEGKIYLGELEEEINVVPNAIINWMYYHHKHYTFTFCEVCSYGSKTYHLKIEQIKTELKKSILEEEPVAIKIEGKEYKELLKKIFDLIRYGQKEEEFRAELHNAQELLAALKADLK